MPSASDDIRYVCLSDLHLGEVDSILTPLRAGGREVDPDTVGPILEQLVLCLENLIAGNRGEERPVLILNGDALELAFGTFAQALANFERLARLLLERELFDKLVYIPGNHDHHIWEVARETQYATTAVESTGPNDGFPPLRHVTPPRPEGAVPAYLLNKIIERVHPPRGPDHRDHEVFVVYPNLALTDTSGDRCVLFHHGHYVESLYHFFSDLRRWLFPDCEPPETVDELEAENFAWIEFVWSMLGRAGGAGADMRTLFRMLRDPDRFGPFASDLARRIAEVRDLAWIPGNLVERVALERLFRWAGPKLSGERARRATVQSPEIRVGIERYLFGPAFRQLRDELGRVPDDLTFVYGHTHKPYEDVMEDPADRRTVRVYNTGGWPIDSREPSDVMGASVLLMNERLDIACLRIYNDRAPDGDVSLEVRATTQDEPGGSFRSAVARRVWGEPDGAAAAPWRELEARIHRAIRRRRSLHESPDPEPAG